MEIKYCVLCGIYQYKEGVKMILNNNKDKPDTNKFEACYNKYKNYMYSIAYEKLQDIYYAEDAVQNAFEKLARIFFKIGNINSEYTKNLIKIITINTCKDMLRKRNKNLATVPLEAAENELYINDCYDFLLDISKYMHNIPKKYTDVLILKYIYGFTSKEIAIILETKESTIRSNISRGKVLLAQKLKENGIDI